MDIERVDDIIQRKLQNPEFKFYWDRLAENPDADVDELEREYHRLYDKSSPEVINTSSMVTDILIQTLRDTPNSTILDFEKENKKVKKIKNNLWEVGGKKFNMPGLLKFLNITNTRKIKEDIEMDKDNKILRDRIRSQIEKLEKNDLLVYNATTGSSFNKLLVKINNLHPEYYIIWNENYEGEVANLIKYSSLENVIDWIIRDAASYTPKLLKNKYIKMEEDWEFDNVDITKYIDLYVCMEKFDNPIEENEFLAGAKEALDEEINSDLEYVRVTLGEVNGEVVIVPIFEEVNSIPGLEGVSASEFLENSFDKDYLGGMSFHVIDEAYRIRHIILGEISTINADLKKFADQWGFEKAVNKRSTPMTEGLGYVYVDRRGNEKVDLEYNDLHIKFNYGPIDWDTGVRTEEFDQDIDYTYTIDKNDISEFLVNLDDLYETDKEFATFIDVNDYDGCYSYIDQHFDKLVEKYYNKILEYFREDAERKAIEEINPEDYIPYPDYDDWGD